jgi:hypothetical protein
MLPTKIRSIKKPTWTDRLTWSVHQSGRCVADVDHDYRISCDANGNDAITWHKAHPFDRNYFPTVAGALESLDYRLDA